jgi:hypothetical protein
MSGEWEIRLFNWLDNRTKKKTTKINPKNKKRPPPVTARARTFNHEPFTHNVSTQKTTEENAANAREKETTKGTAGVKKNSSSTNQFFLVAFQLGGSRLIWNASVIAVCETTRPKRLLLFQNGLWWWCHFTSNVSEWGNKSFRNSNWPDESKNGLSRFVFNPHGERESSLGAFWNWSFVSFQYGLMNYTTGKKSCG